MLQQLFINFIVLATYNSIVSMRTVGKKLEIAYLKSTIYTHLRYLIFRDYFDFLPTGCC
jgi:hypothetical protein